jgi:hypothetical protein
MFSPIGTKSRLPAAAQARKPCEVPSPGSSQSCSSMMTSGKRSAQPVSAEKSSPSAPSMSILATKGA